jgi:hypothetical protein
MGEIIMTGLFALGGVAVGASMGAVTDRWRWKRTARLEAAVLLARTYELVWGDLDHSTLVIHLASLRMHLLGLEVKRSQIEGLEQAALACWSNGHNHLEATYERGVGTALLDAFQASSRAIEAALFVPRQRLLRRGG